MEEKLSESTTTTTDKPGVVVDLTDKQIHILGTAHVSKASVEEVSQLIDTVKPDTVCVELCESRYYVLKNPQQWAKLDLGQVIRENRASLLLAQVVLSAYQRRLGEKLQIKPGAEMLEAIELAEKHNLKLVLADRDIRITMLRTWRNMRFLDKLKVLFMLPWMMLASPEVSAKEIEEIKNEDTISSILKEITKTFPTLKTSLIDERDIYLAEQARQASGKVVLLVIGAGHLEGVLKQLQRPVADLEPLRQTKPRGWTRYWPWVIPMFIVGMFAYAVITKGAAVSSSMLLVWVIANSTLAALGSLIVLAHPLTVIAAAVAAPFTSVNPLVAAGWVAGVVEVWLRKPRVQDFENIHSDILELRGFWRNRITRILLLVALVNLGSTIGTVWGVVWISSLFVGG